MKKQLTIMMLLLCGVLIHSQNGLSQATAPNPDGELSDTHCATSKTIIDEDDPLNPVSIRTFEGFFGHSNELERGCTSSITLQNNLVLRRGLVFRASTTGQFVIDGGGFTIKTTKIPEKDVCVLTIQGEADEVIIKNLVIDGNQTTPLDGICLYTQNNRIENVRVSKMGRRGIVIAGKGNQVGAGTDSSGKRLSSIIGYNRGPGIFVTQTYVESANRVDADTILFQNSEDVFTVNASPTPTPAAEDPLATLLGGEANGEENHPFPAPPVVPMPTYEKGQQVYVVNDKTSYDFHYKKTGAGEVLVSNSFVQVQNENGVGAGLDTVLLIISAEDKTGPLNVANLSLNNTLLGVITQLEGAALDAKFPVPTGQTQLSAKRIGSINTKTGKMTSLSGSGGIKFSASQIYLIVYPKAESVASSTGKIDLTSGTGLQDYCFVANKLDPACQEAGTGGLGGSGGGVFGDGGDFFDDDGNFGGGGTDTDGDGTPDTPAFANHLEVSQLIEDAVKKDCVGFQFGGQTAYDTDDDLDGDGIASAIEDSDTPDCEPQGNETVPYLYDTDHDGLGDGEEDANHNGYVDCKIVSLDANGKPNVDEVGAELVPTFRGTKADPNDATKTVECEDNDTACNTLTDEKFLGKRVPVPSSLGLNIGYGNWKGVPRFVKVAGEKSDALQLTNKFVVCSETDPRVLDSDGDDIPDGQEARRRLVDYTTPAYVYDLTSKSRKTDKINKQNKINCDSKLLGDINSKVLRTFVAYDYDPQVRRIEWASCQVGNPIAEGWADSYNQNTDAAWGETNPHLPDTDFDTLTDLNADPCPNNPLQNCERECVLGWKDWQVSQVAGLKLDPTVDETKRTQMFDQAKVDLKALMQRNDLAAKAELEAKLSAVNSPMNNGQSDNDNIPDLIEAGLQESGTAISDCPDNSVQFLNRTSPFKKWTDQELVSKDTNGDGIKDAVDATKVNDKIVYDDHNDPCPGSSIKIGGKTFAKDLGCMTEKPSYIGKMPLAACYYDRDNDGLFDCLEDKNVNGLWDKKDGETSPLKAKSNNSVPDLATQQNVDADGNPLSALTDDTDGDGLPDEVEISKGGSDDYYDPVKNVGLCNPNLASGGADQKGEGFWDPVPITNPPHPLQKKGFEYIFAFDTDPFNKDTDGDGIEDGDEMKFGYSPANADSDGDGVCDGPKDVAEAKCVAGEDQNGDGKFPFFTPGDPTTLSFGNPGESNPCDPNTDHHGKFDDQDTCKNVPDENCISPNAMGTDSDSDGIPDLTEIQFTNTDPFDKDTDKDGLLDGCLLDPQTKQIKEGSGELCNQMKFGQFFSSFDQLNSPDCGGPAEKYYGCDTNPLSKYTDGSDQLTACQGAGINDKQKRTYPLNPIVKDTDSDCIPDCLEELHFTKQADGSYVIIPGSIDGTFAGCNDVPAGDAGIGKICTETNADNWDTDGDQLADGNIGNVGEDLDCNGVQNLEVGTLLPLETSPKTWDTDADGESDYAEMTRFGGFNISQNLSRATSGRSGGCSLAANDHTATRGADLVLLLLLVGLPLAVLTRTRRQA